jgi:CDGSH-type Zn-finger protein
MPGGPVLLRGDLHVTGPGGVDEREPRAALCSCGRTANAPYCDGTGTCVDWPDRVPSEPAPS